MFGLIIVAGVLGLIAGIVGDALLGWLVFGAVFILGLPLTLICMLIHGEVEYVQDCAYERQLLAELSADLRAAEHEDREDERARNQKRGVTQIYADNRQVHFQSGGTGWLN
jgi:hypothetical protein